MDKNENTIGFPANLVKEMLGSFSPDMLASYPEPFLLHNKLAKFLNIPKERILLASGSDAAIKNCFETFVSRGDEIISLFPTYAMVGVYSQLFGAKLISIGYDQALNLDFEGLLKKIREGARLLYVANPNSPTGTVIEKEQIRSLCRECQCRDIVLLIDEAYYYFCPDSALELTNEFPNLIITRTFSKALGLASVRLGYIVTSAEIADWLSRWRPIYEVNSFAQHCGSFILDNWTCVEQYVQEVLVAKEWFTNKITAIGLEAFPSSANFLLVRFPVSKIAKAVKVFANQGILIKGGGEVFPLSQTLRFTLGVREQMEKCIPILEKLITE